MTELIYPGDAEEHFHAIHRAMSAWAQKANHTPHVGAGFSGPWIENWWITTFSANYTALKSRSAPLSATFGAYVPLFLPWVDLWVKSGVIRVDGNRKVNLGAAYSYPPGFVDALLSVLRPEVPYVTVSQNAEGITGKNELPMAKIPNVLVLSAGGYGHVPVPLLKQPEAPYHDPVLNHSRHVHHGIQQLVSYRSKHHRLVPSSSSVHDGPEPWKRRPFLVSYLGSMENAPDNFRHRVKEVVKQFAHEHKSRTAGWGYAKNWRDVMAQSKASLVIRGFGRTAYHLMETLQMGFIPVYVYSDVAWVPYSDLFHSIGFVTGLGNLSNTLNAVHEMAPSEAKRRERRALAFVPTHFSFQGAMDQIGKFLRDPASSDLRCQQLPRKRVR